MMLAAELDQFWLSFDLSQKMVLSKSGINNRKRHLSVHVRAGPSIIFLFGCPGRTGPMGPC